MAVVTEPDDKKLTLTKKFWSGSNLSGSFRNTVKTQTCTTPTGVTSQVNAGKVNNAGKVKLGMGA